jgi:hypothetical protein
MSGVCCSYCKSRDKCCFRASKKHSTDVESWDQRSSRKTARSVTEMRSKSGSGGAVTVFNPVATLDQ